MSNYDKAARLGLNLANQLVGGSPCPGLRDGRFSAKVPLGKLPLSNGTMSWSLVFFPLLPSFNYLFFFFSFLLI
jgi:hypothetical protein